MLKLWKEKLIIFLTLVTFVRTFVSFSWLFKDFWDVARILNSLSEIVLDRTRFGKISRLIDTNLHVSVRQGLHRTEQLHWLCMFLSLYVYNEVNVEFFYYYYYYNHYIHLFWFLFRLYAVFAFVFFVFFCFCRWSYFEFVMSFLHVLHLYLFMLNVWNPGRAHTLGHAANEDPEKT